MAIAVSNAGGLGSLPCALLGPDAMRAELAAIQAQCSKPFNVNFFCHTPPAPDAAREANWHALLAPYYRELGIDPGHVQPGAPRRPFDAAAAEVLSEFKPAVVSFHFGLPAPELVARVKSWGAMVLSSATTLEEGLWLEERGVDAIIAQGVEAGGHRGIFLTDDLTDQPGTSALVAQLVARVKVPVIAAGGIANAVDVAAAIKLGAAAVQIGTAYLLCPEATTSAVHRAALKSDAARFTELTNVFTGRPARGIVNRLMREQGPINHVAPPFPLAAAAVMPLRAKAESQGSGDFSSLWSGTNPSGCKEISAALLTQEFAANV